ncbi:MAG: hypothetical protein ACPG4T_20580 [Nannocystaceae bacterium]
MAVAAEGLNEVPVCRPNEDQTFRNTGVLATASEATVTYGRAGEKYAQAVGEYRQATRAGEAAIQDYRQAHNDWIKAREALRHARI